MLPGLHIFYTLRVTLVSLFFQIDGKFPLEIHLHLPFDRLGNRKRHTLVFCFVISFGVD